MPDNEIKTRAESVAKTVKDMRDRLPAIEWAESQRLGLLQQLAEIVAEMSAESGGANGRTSAKADAGRTHTLLHLLFLAARSVQAGLTGPDRDAEIRRVLTAWGVNESELSELGYGGER